LSLFLSILFYRRNAQDKWFGTFFWRMKKLFEIKLLLSKPWKNSNSYICLKFLIPYWHMKRQWLMI
jgi:hypothetical protein